MNNDFIDITTQNVYVKNFTINCDALNRDVSKICFYYMNCIKNIMLYFGRNLNRQIFIYKYVY